MKNKILIIGAGGYVGTLLTNHLLKQGYNVIAFDTFWFGNHLTPHEKLTIIQGDLRFYDFKKILSSTKSVIHLACLSNDPSYELNPIFSKEINYDGSVNLYKACMNSNIERFIFASSSSVYGLKDEEQVTEELSPNPLTPYSFFKLKIEEELKIAAQGSFDLVILRPATLCGPSPRMRLDIIGNIFASQAFFERKLTIDGGMQFRPQLNIKDMVRAYEMCLLDSKDFNGACYNIGEGNYTVLELAKKVQSLCPFSVELKINDIFDNRSYRLNSEKIKLERNFIINHTVDEAINDMFEYFLKNNLNWNEPQFHNIKTIKMFLEKTEPTHFDQL